MRIFSARRGVVLQRPTTAVADEVQNVARHYQSKKEDGLHACRSEETRESAKSTLRDSNSRTLTYLDRQFTASA